MASLAFNELIQHYRWNGEKTQMTSLRTTLENCKGILWVQINLHTIWKKFSHHLHRTARPRIQATNNTYTPQCTLRTQLFSHNAIHTKRHTLTISAKYQATIATYKWLSRTYQLLWRNETYTSTRTQLKNSQSIGATLSGMIVEYCKAFPTTLNV